MSVEDHIAEGFDLLIATVQQNDIIEHDRAWQEERARAAELRKQQNAGLNATELLHAMSGDDPATRQARLDAEITKMDKDAAAAAAAKEKSDGRLDQAAKFPAPGITAGT